MDIFNSKQIKAMQTRMVFTDDEYKSLYPTEDELTY